MIPIVTTAIMINDSSYTRRVDKPQGYSTFQIQIIYSRKTVHFKFKYNVTIYYEVSNQSPLTTVLVIILGYLFSCTIYLKVIQNVKLLLRLCPL